MNDQEKALATARVWQPLVCLSLLAGIGLSALALHAAIHDEALGVWMDINWAKVNEGSNEYKRQYLDTEDRVVLEEVADLDPSQGGVYFFGDSNMKWAMRAPDLPPEQRRLVHNLGAGEGSPYFHRQFTEFLVDHKNLLQAGPEKTLIVYGAGFLNAKPASDSPTTVFSNMWRRHGLYSYDFQKGIEPIAQGKRLRRLLSGKGPRRELRARPDRSRRADGRAQGLAAAGHCQRRRRLRRQLQESHGSGLGRGDRTTSPRVARLAGLRAGARHGFRDRVAAPGQLAPRASLSGEISGHDRGFLRTNHVPLIDESNRLTDDEILRPHPRQHPGLAEDR